MVAVPVLGPTTVVPPGKVSTTVGRGLTVTGAVALVADPTLFTISVKTCGPDPLAVRT